MTFLVSKTDMRLEQFCERAVTALSRVLGPGDHAIAPVQSKAGRMYRFSLSGDQRQGLGRMLITPAGEVKIWHQGLTRPWLNDPAFRSIEVGGADRGRGPTPGYAIRLDDFERLQSGLLTRVRNSNREISRPAQATERLRPSMSEHEIHALALQSLAANGWIAQRSSGGITYLNDGEGSTPAGRLVVKDGYAMCWSFRGNMRLGEPWRAGRDLKDGTPCHVASGKDLAGLGLDVRRPVRVQWSQSRQLADGEKIQSIQATWTRLSERAQICPANHRHLVKGAASADKALPADGLITISDGRLEGAIAVPMLRESDKPGHLHVVGVQALLAEQADEGNDKQLLANSSVVGSFTPWPLPPVRDGKFDLRAWIDSRDKTKPIVLCEGVATALAVHHASAGHAVICFSAANLPAVAKYFVEREFGQVHGIVVAADNDIAIKRDGTLKSPGVLRAIRAARECGGEIAFMGKSAAVGADARDLYAIEGPSAVRRYIERAQHPDEVEQRFEKVVRERREGLEKPQLER